MNGILSNTKVVNNTRQYQSGVQPSQSSILTLGNCVHVLDEEEELRAAKGNIREIVRLFLHKYREHLFLMLADVFKHPFFSILTYLHHYHKL